MMARAALRRRWYSRSVSVMAGATVIESPVWTPIGSKFSMVQMTPKLSALSRMTSSSYSFHPSRLSSIRHSWIGLHWKAQRIASSNSALLYATPPPEPPSVNDGRKMTGKPMRSAASLASSMVRATSARALSRPILSIAALKSSRSSALRMASTLAPISSTPCSARMPRSASSNVRFNAV